MAKLTVNDTKHVAQLAKLHLKDTEIKKFTDQLSKVVDYIDELKEVNTAHVEPTAQTTKLTNVLRQDIAKSNELLTQNEALSGTDNTQNGFFIVPQIISKT